MQIDAWNLLVSVLVLIGTLVSVWFARTKRPHFRLDHMQIRPNTVNGRLDLATRWSVGLVFVNDGPGIAPAANAFARGALQDWHEPEIQYPHNGSPTLRVGSELEVRVNVFPIPMPDGFHQRRYMKGDDFFFDLSGVAVRFEWGKPHWWGKRSSQKLTNLHRDQQNASPQFDKP